MSLWGWSIALNNKCFAHRLSAEPWPYDACDWSVGGVVNATDASKECRTFQIMNYVDFALDCYSNFNDKIFLDGSAIETSDLSILRCAAIAFQWVWMVHSMWRQSVWAIVFEYEYWDPKCYEAFQSDWRYSIDILEVYHTEQFDIISKETHCFYGNGR